MPRTVLNGRTVSASRTVAPPPAPSKAKAKAAPAVAPQILPDLSAMVAQAVAQAVAAMPAARPVHVPGNDGAPRQELALGVTIKLNKSGGFYVHDGRFGFNLYVGNWKVIKENFKAINSWVDANRASLRSK